MEFNNIEHEISKINEEIEKRNREIDMDAIDTFLDMEDDNSKAL